MRRRMFLSKIHRARITHADLDYEGSCTIDADLMDAADMLPNLVTYALPGPRGSGVICINGAAAHGNKPDDLVILATFGEMDSEEARAFEPTVVMVDRQNRLRSIRAEIPGPQMPPPMEVQ